MSHLSWGGQCPCATPPTFTTPARGETESQSGQQPSEGQRPSQRDGSVPCPGSGCPRAHRSSHSPGCPGCRDQAAGGRRVPVTRWRPRSAPGFGRAPASALLLFLVTASALVLFPAPFSTLSRVSTPAPAPALSPVPAPAPASSRTGSRRILSLHSCCGDKPYPESLAAASQTCPSIVPALPEPSPQGRPHPDGHGLDGRCPAQKDPQPLYVGIFHQRLRDATLLPLSQM